MTSIEASTMRKVTWRVLPFICLLYFVNWLDRVNVGFGALTMNKALGLSPAVFGFGASVFFIGYILLEVPSNLALRRFGTRIWIARIMITWGLVSGAMAFVQGPTSFYVVRFLLGVAEAGFAPAILLYIMTWFPEKYRGRAFGIYIVTNPISSIIGAPVSGLLFKLDGTLGLADWQWMFLMEAVPAVVLGIVALFYLTDAPRQASWLEPAQRKWLEDALSSDGEQNRASHHAGIAQAFRSGRIWTLGLIYMCPIIGIYALSFWMPQIIQGLVKQRGIVDPLSIGLLTAVPSLLAVVAIIVWTRHSDKTQERRWHMVVPLVVGAAGLVASGYLHDPVTALLALSVAMMGINVAIPMFWALPSASLTGTLAVVGIAIINSVGNFGGFIGPQLVGFVKQSTGSFTNALVVIACLMVAAAVVVFALESRRVALRPATVAV